MVWMSFLPPNFRVKGVMANAVKSRQGRYDGAFLKVVGQVRGIQCCPGARLRRNDLEGELPIAKAFPADTLNSEACAHLIATIFAALTAYPVTLII